MEITYSCETERKIHELGEWLGAGSINGFGRQFAGKDTQLGPLASTFDVPIIGGGDILRNVEIPEDVKAVMESGALIPSDTYEQIVLPYLSRPSFEHKPLLLSAVGRMDGEQAGVMQATSAANHTMRLVVDFQITRQESHYRMANSPSRGRADDTIDGLNKRLNFFDEHTVPVIDYYKSQGLLVTVDATAEINVVFNNFINLAHDRATGKG